MKSAAGVIALLGGGALICVDVGDAVVPEPQPEAFATEVVTADRLWQPAPEVGFVGVRDMAVSENGVWVLDSAEPFVTWIPRSGAGVSRFGSEGQGPTELLNPLDLEVEEGPDDEVRVWDAGNARVFAFDPQGSLLGAEPMGGASLAGIRSDIRNVTYADPFRVRRVGDEYILASYPDGVSHTADFLEGMLVRADRTLETIAPIVSFSSEAVHAAATRTRLEFTAVPLWDACPDLVVTWLPERGTVRWVDMDGELRHETPVPLEPAPMTLDDIEAYLRLMARLELGPGWEDQVPDLRAVARAQRGAFALEAPVATEIHCGTDGSAWLRTFSTDVSPLGLGPDWLRVAPSGSVTRVSFPEPFSPKAFTSDEAFGIWTDELGLQHLVRWGAAPVRAAVTQ